MLNKICAIVGKAGMLLKCAGKKQSKMDTDIESVIQIILTCQLILF